jgi:thymidylate synthase (FAD)
MMKFVQPKAYKIAETKLIDDGVLAWLTDLGGEECLAHVSGSDGEKLIELAGRRCYKSYKEGLNPNVTKIRKDSDVYHENVLKSGHGSVDEHSSVTFAFENVSRVFTHELVRHRAGTAMSQESLRFVRLDKLSFWMPKIFKEAAEKSNNPRVRSEAWNEAEMLIKKTLTELEEVQRKLAELYDIENIKDFDMKKKLTSAFRRLAPDGLGTGIVFTFNHRALRHVIEKRTSRHAEEELRLVFGQVAEIVMKDYPFIYGDFEKIDTGDGLFEYIPKYMKV